ncbi:flagellar export ATPase, putative [Babesia ovata]|uniref:Flagellar export ATPase, putative n=1 Tax=Babesia ovata TaxID=189622 RepID=A0A2H6KDH0_9APIC|nr:flagellar export ATPase, putative [Babesia ovata]GBE61024.1 flagellar export ATPase, putative [Babesia ovata]
MNYAALKQTAKLATELEPQFLPEEECVLGDLSVGRVGVVQGLLKHRLKGLASLLARGMVLHLLVGHQGLGVDAAGNGVAGGHQVVHVDVLHEGLDAQALLHLLLAHVTGDLERVLVDTGHQAVGVWAALARALVAVDDDALAARTTAREHDYDAAGFHKLGHPTTEVNHRYNDVQ